MACGNCFERDFGVEDIADHLRILAGVAPSLSLKVHCGDDWEAVGCIATITAGAGGVVVGPAEVAEVTQASADEMRGRLLKMLGR